MKEAETRFKQALKSRRKKIKAAEKKRLSRPQTETIERSYSRAIIALIRDIKKAIIPLQGVLSSALRTDADAGMVEAALRQIKGILSIQFAEAAITPLVSLFASRTTENNRRLFEAFTLKATGQRFFLDESFTVPMIQAFVSQNVALIQDVANETLKKVENVVWTDFRQAASPKETYSKILDIFPGEENRAKLIARDQVSKLNADIDRERQAEVGIDRYIWRTVGDERVRDEHMVLNGNMCRWDDASVYSDDGGKTWESRSSIGGYEGHPGTDFQCIPEDELVRLPLGASKCFRRWYTGELASLVSATGETFRSTPNHPILTNRGWVRAKDIEVGDYLVKATNEVGKLSIGDPVCGYATAKQVFSALGSVGMSHGVRVAAGGFHGDMTDEKVDIILTNWSLLNKVYFKLTQFFCELLFSITNKARFRFCDRTHEFVGFGFAANCLMRFLSKTHAFFFRCLRHSKKHRFASIATCYIIANKNASDYSAGAVEFLSDDFLARSVFIHSNYFTLIKVESVMSDAFSGYVHNFETPTGWYFVNGVLYHNCRCFADPVIEF